MTELDKAFNIRLSKNFYHVFTCMQSKKQNCFTLLITLLIMENSSPQPSP